MFLISVISKCYVGIDKWYVYHNWKVRVRKRKRKIERESLWFMFKNECIIFLILVSNWFNKLNIVWIELNKNMELQGVEPWASCMLSTRSTNWAITPSHSSCHSYSLLKYLDELLIQIKIINQSRYIHFLFIYLLSKLYFINLSILLIH